MNKTISMLAYTALVTVFTLPTLADSQRGERRTPPAAALEACASASEEASCAFVGRGEKSVNGICRTVPSGELACVPEGHRGKRGGQRDKGEDIS